jgi:uncharacterized protein DUF6362
MSWTPEMVRARFVEAADTERRTPYGGVSGKTGFWPSYVHTFEEMNGWGTKRLAQERELRLRRIPPSSGAISRFEEVLEWTTNRIADENRRRLVWAFAHCRAGEQSFSDKCARQGWNRIVAYRRLNATFHRIAIELTNGGVLLRLPDEGRWLQKCEIGVHEERALNNSVQTERDRLAFISERSNDTLKTPAAIAAFVSHLEGVNKVRRRARKRREKKRSKVSGAGVRNAS